MNTLAMSLVCGCAGVLLAWLLRRPVRRLLGAGPAFGLWLLPPLLAAVVWLPAWHVGPTHTAAFLSLPALIVAGPVTATVGDAGIDVIHLLFVLWLAGSGLMLARLALHCMHMLRRSRPLPDTLRAALKPDLATLDPRIIRLHPAGPAVCWLPRCHLLLPADMLERFDRDQRIQVLAHERMHLVRCDPLWSLLAELALAALWFFPPAWLAMNRFHLDQELACDAAMIARSPRQAGAYARALLSGTATPRLLSMTTAWLSRSQLKERLTMIQNHSHTLLTRRAGYTTLGLLLAAMALGAHATMPVSPQPTPQATAASSASADKPPILLVLLSKQNKSAQSAATRPASVILTFRRHHPPRYPPAAIKKHQEGTVTLLVQVGTDGQPLQIKTARATNAPQDLITAAKKAAWRWRYNAARRNGKAVKAWALVPVIFRLDHSPQSPGSTAHPGVNMAYRGQHPPRYPPVAIKNHKQGTVVLLVLVDKQGRAAKVKIKHGVAPALDEAAVKAAENWQFNPAVRDGKPYEAWVQVPVKFSLQEPVVVNLAPSESSAKH